MISDEVEKVARAHMYSVLEATVNLDFKCDENVSVAGEGCQWTIVEAVDGGRRASWCFE